MFLGEFEHAIDDKGRLAIPAKFRPPLEQGLFLTRGVDRCLVIWDTESWRAMADRVRGLNPWQNDARRMQRHFFSGAVPAQPDRLGRVVIPHYLRAYANLEAGWWSLDSPTGSRSGHATRGSANVSRRSTTARSSRNTWRQARAEARAR